MTEDKNKNDQKNDKDNAQAAEDAIDVSQYCPKGDVLVIAEHILGDLQPVTLELLGAGRILADKMDRSLKCLVMGHKLGDMPQTLVEYGADEVYVADHQELENYRTLPYRRVVCDFLESLPEPPHTCLLGSTPLFVNGS